MAIFRFFLLGYFKSYITINSEVKNFVIFVAKCFCCGCGFCNKKMRHHTIFTGYFILVRAFYLLNIQIKLSYRQFSGFYVFFFVSSLLFAIRIRRHICLFQIFCNERFTKLCRLSVALNNSG